MTKYTIACIGNMSEGLIRQLSALGVVDIKRSKIPVDEYSDSLLQKAQSIRETAQGKELSAEISSLKAREAALQKEYEDCSMWGDCLPKELSEIEDAGYRINFHILSEKEFKCIPQGDFPLEVISVGKGKVRFVTVSKAGQEAACPGETVKPRGQQTILEEMEGTKVLLKEKEEEFDRLADSRDDLMRQYDGIIADLDSYLAAKASILSEEDGTGCGDLSRHLDIFEAYAPESEENILAEALNIPGIWYSSERAKQDDTPVKLHNNRIIREFEVFTRMYGLPAYSEFDPTPILGPFFLLFFSMCMGDAGYGLLLVAIAFILKRKMPDSALGRLNGLITMLGIGTFITGLFLGTFFGMNLYEKSWVPDALKRIMLVEDNIGKVAGFDPQIVIALGIGIFHICLAMIVKAICFTSRTGFRQNLGTWGWTLLVVGGIAAASCSIGGLLGGDALRLTIIVIAVISGLGIFLFNNPQRHILKNVGAGLWDSYNMLTGLLGDTLSYLRLYALGLAGGLLGSAFNNLGTMVLGDSPSWQWIPFIIIVVLGHALNLAMSCLGAFVHPLRLSFVEYFKNSGYEGKGVEYRPLSKKDNNQ